MGKNQIEIKDNHGHTTKVHRRDVKKIPMTENVYQLYEEEQTGKVKEWRKAVPSSKMPDLGWDIAETHLQKECKQVEVQENSETNNPRTALPLQGNDCNSHHNNNHIRTHHSICSRNPRSNKKSNTSGKIFNHKNQS